MAFRPDGVDEISFPAVSPSTHLDTSRLGGGDGIWWGASPAQHSSWRDEQMEGDAKLSTAATRLWVRIAGHETPLVDSLKKASAARCFAGSAWRADQSCATLSRPSGGAHSPIGSTWAPFRDCRFTLCLAPERIAWKSS
jgi:hypothetical protein